MKHLFVLLLLCFSVTFLMAQVSPEETARIRQQMAKIRQTTNWDDPAAARKANEDIQKLAIQLSGGKSLQVQFPQKTAGLDSLPKDKDYRLKSAVSESNILTISNRFFKRSYKMLDPASKIKFDLDYKEAEKANFSLAAVRKLTTAGAILISFGEDHHLACVYLTAAVTKLPADTLSINNFGGYLRIVDSVETSLPVLLYANKLFSQSPVILTQIGCSYFELNDFKQAENFLKEAVKYNPGFGQAHTALCELYIKQNRLQDAILELFAGVKGMGASYRQSSGNFSYLQQQAENSDTKGDFWEETRNQVNPEDALASLVPEDIKLKMPEFPNCSKVGDWMEGGGYTTAVQGYTGYHTQMMKFSGEFQRVHKELPDLPPNAILRDYPNERFALDCITEYFFQKSDKEAKNFEEKLDEIMQKVYDEAGSYHEKKEGYTKEYTNCCNGCGADSYCIKECERVYCTEECPAAKIFNTKLQEYFEDYQAEFRKTTDNQKVILDDLYAFSEQWFSKIQSQYWSRIYAYEIQSTARTVIGNAYAAYPRAFPFGAHNNCGTDCSLFANPYPYPAEQVEEKEPRQNNCPQDSKISLSMVICSIDLECESIEFGCSAGVAFSLKRNFQNKCTTSFIGVGAEAGLGVVKGEAKAGFTFTQYDNGNTDTGVKAELTATVGAGVSKGTNYEFTATVMEGARVEQKTVYGAGL